LTSAWKTAESDRVTTNPATRETEDEKKGGMFSGESGAHNGG
jgi:hypothetical protein